MTPTVKLNGKAPPRTRRTRAQIEEDLIASGIPASARATPAAIKRSRLAAQKRCNSAAPSTKLQRDSPPFQLVDYQTIVAYLSRPNVCNSIFGGGSSTRVSGMPMNPTSILNSLAMQLNNNYNIRNNSTDMRLNGRVLHQRLKRFKSKYTKTKAFSLKTGSGLSAKNVADGIHTMPELLESMCPCFDEMDTLFRDKGNINPFGVLDTGIDDPFSDHDEDEDQEDHTVLPDAEEDGGSTTDGHDHSVAMPVQRGDPRQAVKPIQPVRDRFSSPDAEELEAYQALFESQQPQRPEPSVELSADQQVNAHYRSFLDNDLQSPPPTPKVPEDPPAALPQVRKAALLTQPPRKTPGKRKSLKKDTLTAEERMLDDSSEEDSNLADARPGSTQVRPANRATLARRAVDPLPSIDPSTVRGKDYKHPVATAMQVGNAAKIDMLRAANEWRQKFDSARLESELEARKSDLSWAKERFFLEREEERNRIALVTRNERKAFCEKLVLEGKTPQELEAYLRLVYPEESPAS